MNPDRDAEKPKPSETPTADAVAEFLKGVRRIQEQQKVERLVNPTIARLEVKEFAKTEEEIMQLVKSFPAPQPGEGDTYTDEIYPGVLITGRPDSETATLVGIYTEEADLPFNPELIEGFNLGIVEQNPVLDQQEVSPKYVLSYEAYTDPNHPPLFQDTPIPGQSKHYILNFYFDEYGNYLKDVHIFNFVLELEELTPPSQLGGFSGKQKLKGAENYLSAILGYKIDLGIDRMSSDEQEKLANELPDVEFVSRHYKSEMTANDFELVGFSLQLLKDKLIKAKQGNPE